MSGGSLLINNSGASGANPNGGGNGAALAGIRVGNGTGSSGALNVSGGALTLGASDEFLVGYNGGSGTVTVGSGGTLNIGAAGRIFIGGQDGSGGTGGATGTVTVNNGGLLTSGASGAFPNDQVYLSGYGGSGTINLNGGTLGTGRQITGGASTINFNGGTFQVAFSGGIPLNGMSHAYVLAGGAIINTAGNVVNMTQNLLTGASPDGGLTVQGPGMLMLPDNNTFNGNTLVKSGTLDLASTQALFDSTLDTSGSGSVIFGLPGTYTFGGLQGPNALTLSTTAGVAFTFNVGNNNQNTTYSGSLLGNSTLTKIGTGTTTLAGNNTSAYTGGMTVTAGGLALTGNNAYTGATTVSAGALTIGPTGTLNASGGLTVSGAGAVLNVNGTINQTTGTAVGTVITAGGVVNFSGTGDFGLANTQAILVGGGGAFNITGGSLLTNYNNGNGWAVGNASAGTLNVSGGVLNVANNNVFFVGFNSSAGAGVLDISGSGLVSLGTPNATAYLFGHGGSSGTVNLMSGGTLSSARNIITNGGTSVFNFNGGVLQAAAGSATFMSGLTAANVQAGGAYINPQGYSIAIPQNLLTGASPDGGLTDVGSGTLTLSGTNTYNGGTTVNAGLLEASTTAALPSYNVAGKVHVASGGTLALPVGGAGQWNSGSTDNIARCS